MMARTREEIISEMVDSGLFNDDEIRKVVAEADSSPTKTYTRGFVKTYEGKPKTLPQKLDVGAANTAEFLLNLGNAPFEMAGEAMAAPLEGRAAKLPTVLGGEAPANPLSVVNKLLRAGAGAVSGIPSGTPGASARNAYNAPRGPMGAVEDTALAALLGKVAPEVLAAPADAATVGLKKAVTGTASAAGKVGKKLITTMLGPTEEAQAIRLSRPQDVARQTDFTGLGDRVAETANALQENLKQLDEQAWGKLLTLKAEPKSKIIQLLKNVRRDYVGKGGTSISDADQAAIAQIDKYIERVSKIKQPGATPGTEVMLDQPQIKELVQSVRRDATYGLVKNEPVNRAVKDVGHAIDQYLKGQNKDYEEAMKPVREATSALTDTIKRFRLELNTADPSLGYVPTSTTLTNLKALTTGKKPEVLRAADQIKATTGVDLADEAKLTAVKEQFEPKMRAQGSRRVNAFKGAGAALGFGLAKLLGISPWGPTVAGGAAGGELGAITDVYGGPMTAKILDLVGKGGTGVASLLSAVQNKTQGTPYQEIIQRLIAGEPFLAPVLRGNR